MVEKRDIIFITDEQKSDWWYKLGGKVIGPRIELINEFSYETKKKLYMFSPMGFINRNEDIVNARAANEVEELATSANFEKMINEFAHHAANETARSLDVYMSENKRPRVQTLLIRFESIDEVSIANVNNAIESFFQLKYKRVRGIPKIAGDYYNIKFDENNSIYTSQFFVDIKTDSDIETIFFMVEDALKSIRNISNIELVG
ncbi:hypothetical protein FJP00_13295 [Bacillus safensis]|nr:hypothetical protein [Bacillus safensis]